MRVERHGSAAAFLARARDWLLADEVEHSVLLAQALAWETDEARGPLPPDGWRATVEEDGRVVACGLRRSGHKFAVTSGPAAAIGLLAGDAFAARSSGLDLVGGPEPAAGQFARAWAERAGVPAPPGMRQRLFALERVIAPLRPAPGGARLASLDDRELLLGWTADFLAEAGAATHHTPASLVAELVGGGRLSLWQDGGPVSMAAWTGRTPHGARVILVYTPRAARGHGYASSLVASLSDGLLAGGCRYVCLHTDLANPISNRIYQAIGFRPVHDAGEHVLGR